MTHETIPFSLMYQAWGSIFATVDSPQSGFPRIESFLKLTDFAATDTLSYSHTPFLIQKENEIPLIEQFLKVTRLQDPEAIFCFCFFFALRTRLCISGHKYHITP
jgi:hypothetical protein